MVLHPTHRKPYTIEVDELAAGEADSGERVILDVRFSPGKAGRRDDYIKVHVPGALYIDLPNELADAAGRAAGRGSNPLPSPDHLQASLRRLGISIDSEILVYDDTNGAPAARAWWVLTWAGLGDVRLLNGGLTAWKAAGLPLESGDVSARVEGTVDASPGQLPALDADGAATFPAEGTLIDVRPSAQFGPEGTGHLPGAKSLPLDRLLGPDNRLLPTSDIAHRLHEAGIDTSRPLAAYCGGGVASSLFVLALARAETLVSLYPGSWSEWSADVRRPIER